MDSKTKIRKHNINMSFAILALLLMIAYILIDGMGMFANTYNILFKGESVDNATVVDLLQRDDSSAILRNMIELQVWRIVYLSVMLYPIFFTMLRFHIPLKNNKTDIQRLIPYLRIFIGFMAFYYAMTIGTQFSHELFTNYYSFGYWGSYFRIIASFLIFGAFIIDWPSFIRAIKGFPASHPKLNKVLFVSFISVCSCMLVEYQVASKMNMVSYMLVFNILYWLIVLLFVDLITRNVKIGAFVSLGLAYLIGLVNDVVYQFRGNYVMYGDLTVVRTALEVAGNYKYKPGFWFWLSLSILILAVTITVIIRISKHKEPSIKEIAIRAGLTAVLVVCVLLTFRNGMLYRNVFGVGWDYNTNVKFTGYIPYFLSNMNSISTVTLDGYSADLAAEALDMDEDAGTYTYPNIIIIQNEAFADLSVLYDIETNQDYMPFIHSLTENTRKGYLNMSVTGGPTSNTEFEVLMRSSLSFLPYGSVPYTQYVNADLPSAVQVLRNQSVPYYTLAYHPYYSSGYRRYEVYNHFGFDEIVFEDNYRDDFPEADVPRDYLSDSADYRRVEQMYEDFRSTSDLPWFCFNVTIQNHGGYTQIYNPAEEDRVYVTNFDAPDSLNSYLSLIRLSDEAFGELISYFEQCDEPTIIAMYGDHQPSLDDDAMEALAGHEVESDGNRYNNFYVPYVIWANFDIDEADTLGDLNNDGVMNTLSTNYFASTVFELAGVELTAYDRYLLSLHDSVPAITAIGVWDSEGNYYSSPAASPYADELSALEIIQYNLIFDDDGRLTDRFE